ncbi:MAG: hypothetical protein LBE86_02765 [Gemmobacter sp.]|nr:hypothetical protein [Gemmobacter sp.]
MTRVSVPPELLVEPKSSVRGVLDLLSRRVAALRVARLGEQGKRLVTPGPA